MEGPSYITSKAYVTKQGTFSWLLQEQSDLKKTDFDNRDPDQIIYLYENKAKTYTYKD